MPTQNLSMINGGTRQVELDRVPGGCPVCGRAISPIEITQGYGDQDWAEKIYRCPWPECAHLFLVRYTNARTGAGNGLPLYKLSERHPKTPQPPAFSATIREISNDFCDIYGEASAAEQVGLKLIPGPGYRKALEFLMKDYLCKINPQDAAAIRASQLGRCISEFVKNDKIVTVASRATWLGNDETHYVRKWEGRDLQDLKKLIDLTVLWIEMEETTKQLMADMPDPSKEPAAVRVPETLGSTVGS